MLVAIHQPTFFPWLGYLDRMAQADLFVILDHVQFERRNYQNRTMIRLEDEARWLTVPVVQLSQKEKIIDKRVDNPPEAEGNRWWGPNSFNTLKYAYRKAPFFEAYAAELRDIFHARWDKLLELDMATLEFLRSKLDITTPLLRSSTLAPEGQRSELLLDICRRVKASAFLGGMGGSRAYLDAQAFDAARMGVRWQDFTHPAYPQHGEAPFIKGLSALDLLFNCGPESARILRQCRDRANDELLAAA
ncbi:MAG TPA: WbqC family protein [Usitatibacter sp.]|jgi:replicative DNA helicase|nr:WbqC family protein [Usitatibacter sp.]